MKVLVPYETMKRMYPLEVIEIMSKLRAGRSKEKHRDESELEWGFSWAQQIKACSFEEAFGGMKDKTFAELFQEAHRENVKFFLGDSIHWGIYAKVGRWIGYANPPEGIRKLFIPNEILDLYVNTFNQQIAEKARMAKLTPEEKQAEIADLLKKLRRSPGFIPVRYLP